MGLVYGSISSASQTSTWPPKFRLLLGHCSWRFLYRARDFIMLLTECTHREEVCRHKVGEQDPSSHPALEQPVDSLLPRMCDFLGDSGGRGQSFPTADDRERGTRINKERRKFAGHPRSLGAMGGIITNRTPFAIQKKHFHLLSGE